MAAILGTDVAYAGGGAENAAVTVPVVEVGDLLVAIISYRGSQKVTTLSGFTHDVNVDSSTSTFPPRVRIGTRVVDGNEPVEYALPAGDVTLFLVALRDVDPEFVAAGLYTTLGTKRSLGSNIADGGVLLALNVNYSTDSTHDYDVPMVELHDVTLTDTYQKRASLAALTDVTIPFVSEFTTSAAVNILTVNVGFNPTGAVSPTEGFTDFSDRPTGALSGWTLDSIGSFGATWFNSFTVVEDAGSVGGKHLLLDGTGGTAQYALFRPDAPRFTDGEVLVLCGGTGNASGQAGAVAIRMDPVTNYGYTAAIRHNSSLPQVDVRRTVNGGTVHVGTIDFPYVAYPSLYYIRFSAVGDQIKVKIWAEADPEPEAWSGTYTNTEVSDPGYPSLYIQNGEDFEWDYFSWSTGIAPLPGEGGVTPVNRLLLRRVV